MPTATMSEAPLSSASSIATSSLVPVAGKTTGSTPSAAHPLQARGPAVAVGVHDDLGAAAQRVVGHRVHVADDEVGLVAGLDQRVGAAVDPDQDRPVLADVVAAASAGPPCSGSRAPRSARAGRRARCVMSGTPTPSRSRSRSLRRYSIVFGGERLELDGQPGPGLVHRRLRRRRRRAASPVATSALADAAPRRRRRASSLPSLIAMTSGPTSSISGMPAATRISGPRFG